MEIHNYHKLICFPLEKKYNLFLMENVILDDLIVNNAKEFTEEIVETVPETVPETVVETVPETVPETVVETVPETVVETVPVTVPETVVETVVETVAETVVVVTVVDILEVIPTNNIHYISEQMLYKNTIPIITTTFQRPVSAKNFVTPRRAGTMNFLKM